MQSSSIRTTVDNVNNKASGFSSALEFLWLTTVFLVPLFFNPASHQAFYLNKVLLFQFLVLIMMAITIGEWICRVKGIKGIINKDVITSPLHLCIIIFGIVAIITTVMSISPSISFWGSYARRAGLLTLLCGILFFLIISSHINTRRQVYRIVYVVLISSAIVSFIGIVQSYFPGILFGYQPGTRGVYSTMGNPLALSVFLAMIIPFNIMLILKKLGNKKGRKEIILIFSLILLFGMNFWCLYLAQYSITILLYLIPAVVFLLLFGLIRHKRIVFVSALSASLLLVIVAALILGPILSRIYPDRGYGGVVRYITSSEGLGLKTLQNRTQYWKGTIEYIIESPEVPFSNDILSPTRTFIGYGLETYIITFQSFFSADMQDFRSRLFVPLDRPHNHYLYMAASMGLLGLMSYLAILAVFIFLAFRSIHRSKSNTNRLLLIAIIAGMSGYITDTFFNPSTISAELVFWLLLGMLYILSRVTYSDDSEELQLSSIDEDKKSEVKAHFSNRSRYYVSIGCSVLLIAGIFSFTIKPFLADMYLQRGLNVSGTNTTMAIGAFENAIDLEPGQAVYRGFLGEYSYFVARQESTLNVKRNFLQLSISELEEARALEQYIASRYYVLGDVYMYWALQEAGDNLEKALLAYEQASHLSPHDVLILNKWSLALVLNGDMNGATVKLDDAMAIDSGWIGNSVISAILLYDKERVDEAASVLVEPISEEPVNLKFFIDLCFYLAAYDMVYPIENILTKYSSDNPDEWGSHAMRGITNFSLNIPDKSLNEFDVAMSLVPDKYAGELFRSALVLASYSRIYKGMLSVVAEDWREKLSRTVNADKYLGQLDELIGSSM